jgi:hypothetical protein
MKVNIRPPWPDEVAKLGRTIPSPSVLKPGNCCLVACTEGPRERLLGSLTILRSPPDSGVETGHLHWHVAAAQRGSDLESQLFRSGLSSAKDLGIQRVVTLNTFAPESEEYGTLIKHGFKVGEEIDEFEASFSAVWDRCQRVHALLEKRGAVPERAEITGFSPELLPLLRETFHNNRIVGCLEFDAKLNPHHSEPIDLERSTAILLDGELIGAMMVCPVSSATYSVSARWVAEGHRNSWTNAVLIYNSVRQGVALELDTVRFVAHRGVHKETAVLAERLGGHKFQSRHRLELALDG